MKPIIVSVFAAALLLLGLGHVAQAQTSTQKMEIGGTQFQAVITTTGMTDEVVLEVGKIGYSELVTPTWTEVSAGVYTTEVNTEGWVSIKALNLGPEMVSTVEWWSVDSWWFIRQGDAFPPVEPPPPDDDGEPVTFTLFLPVVLQSEPESTMTISGPLTQSTIVIRHLPSDQPLEVGMYGKLVIVPVAWEQVAPATYKTVVDASSWLSIKALNQGPRMVSNSPLWGVSEDGYWFLRQ